MEGQHGQHGQHQASTQVKYICGRKFCHAPQRFHCRSFHPLGVQNAGQRCLSKLVRIISADPAVLLTTSHADDAIRCKECGHRILYKMRTRQGAMTGVCGLIAVTRSCSCSGDREITPFRCGRECNSPALRHRILGLTVIISLLSTAPKPHDTKSHHADIRLLKASQNFPHPFAPSLPRSPIHRSRCLQFGPVHRFDRGHLILACHSLGNAQLNLHAGCP